MSNSFNALFATLTSPPSLALHPHSRPVVRADRPPWAHLGVHWHGYQGRGPGPNEPARARGTRLTSAGELLRNPAEAGKWIAAAAAKRNPNELLARWDPLPNRFRPMCECDEFIFIRDRVIDLTYYGRSLYLALPAPNRHVIFALEAVTRIECPVSDCLLAGPARG